MASSQPRGDQADPAMGGNALEENIAAHAATLQPPPPTTIHALPPSILRLIHAKLREDARARSLCVSKTWRAVLEDQILWKDLDLSWAPQEKPRRALRRILAGASARARGQLRSVALRTWPYCFAGFDGLLATAFSSASALEVVQISPGCVHRRRGEPS